MDKQPKTSTITATTLQREVGTVLRRVGSKGEHLIVERDGFPMVVIIPLGDYRHLTQVKEMASPWRRS